jgi:hypothetical protein
MDTDRDAMNERERRWQVIESIGDRNIDKDPDEVERDIAEVLAEIRAEERAKKAAVTPGT